MLWWSTLLCAVYLLTGLILGGRSIWKAVGGTSIRDGVGWDWAMSARGVVAIAGLAVDVRNRPRVVVPLIGAAVATLAFAAATYAAGNSRAALLQGTAIPLRWDSGKVEPGELELLHPARPQSYAVIATVGAGFALVLAVSWLERASDKW